MQCGVKGAYPLRVDVFKQGECDVSTKAFAGIIPPSRNWKNPVLLYLMCIRESVCVCVCVWILEEVKVTKLEPSTQPDLLAKRFGWAKQELFLRKRVLIFLHSARAFLKPIQMYPNALPWQPTNPPKCCCHYTAFRHDYATLGFRLEEAT